MCCHVHALSLTPVGIALSDALLRPRRRMLPGLQDLPAPLLTLVAERLTCSDLGRLACCSRELRGRVYVAWPADPEALCLAACHGNLVLLRVQLGAGVPVDTTASGRTMLMHAAECGQDGAVLALLEAGANFSHSDAFGRTALTRAAGCGHELVVQALLAAGAAVDQAVGGRTALRCAAAAGHGAVVCTLLEAGADAEICDW